MSVQDDKMTISIHIIIGFNTSYVSVQASHCMPMLLNLLRFNTSYVSVQAVLTQVSLSIIFGVSIHPMCRFKGVLPPTQAIPILVSIHPMCRFKFYAPLKQIVDFKFQYILCVGSSHYNVQPS